MDLLAGGARLRRVDILADCGRSTNPAVDIGQLQGGFVQGMGMMLSEVVALDEASGRLLTPSTWDYKVPALDVLPRVFNVSLLEGAPNVAGVLGGKASGEPGVMLSAVVASAMQAAVAAAAVVEGAGRADCGDGGVVLCSPATPPAVLAARVACRGDVLDILRAAM